MVTQLSNKTKRAIKLYGSDLCIKANQLYADGVMGASGVRCRLNLKTTNQADSLISAGREILSYLPPKAIDILEFFDYEINEKKIKLSYYNCQLKNYHDEIETGNFKDKIDSTEIHIATLQEEKFILINKYININN
jgi:hypothetical protein